MVIIVKISAMVLLDSKTKRLTYNLHNLFHRASIEFLHPLAQLRMHHRKQIHTKEPLKAIPK
jgi:hypothetical protein